MWNLKWNLKATGILPCEGPLLAFADEGVLPRHPQERALLLQSGAASADHRRFGMNKDHLKGEAEKLKGKANEVAGKVTGDKARELKGDLQQGAGEMRKKVGDAKDAAKDAGADHRTKH
jgi:uncharacterized protein YjbJ (UPF0337 family)